MDTIVTTETIEQRRGELLSDLGPLEYQARTLGTRIAGIYRDLEALAEQESMCREVEVKAQRRAEAVDQAVRDDIASMSKHGAAPNMLRAAEPAAEAEPAAKRKRGRPAKTKAAPAKRGRKPKAEAAAPKPGAKRRGRPPKVRPEPAELNGSDYAQERIVDDSAAAAALMS